jgi:acetyl esterase/lipase
LYVYFWRIVQSFVTIYRPSFRAVTAACLLAVFCLAAAGCGARKGTVSNPVQVRHNLVYGQSNKGLALTEDVYTPNERAKPAPMVIVIHGGFTSGTKRGTTAYASTLASVGFVAVNINYSLSRPGYPEQVKEIQRAIQWNVAHASQFKGDPHRVGIVGFASGGYLGAMASLLDSEQQPGPTSAVVTLSSPLDLPALEQLVNARPATCKHRKTCPQSKQHLSQLSTVETVYRFLGCPTRKCSPRLIKDASPTSHVDSRAPAFLMFNGTGGAVPTSQPLGMAKALRASGVPQQVRLVPDTGHGPRPGSGYVTQATPTIVSFLHQRLGSSPVRLAVGKNPPPPEDPTLLLVLCAAIAGVSLVVVVGTVRKKMTGAVRPLGG